MSTNLDPPVAHVHDVNETKLPTLQRLLNSTDRAKAGNSSPTDLSMGSAVSPVPLHSFNQCSPEYHHDPFLNSGKNSVAGATIAFQTISEPLQRNFGSNSPNIITKINAVDMKYSSSSLKKETLAYDLKKSPSPALSTGKPSALPVSLSGCFNEQNSSSLMRNYQVSPDAMLSATVSMSENEMLREGGFDIPVGSNHITSADDNLLNAGPSSISSTCSSGLRPPSNTNFELFDEESSRDNYAESGQDLRLSPQTSGNSTSAHTESFIVNINRNLIPTNINVTAANSKPISTANLVEINHINPVNHQRTSPVIPTTKPGGKPTSKRTYAGKSGTIPCQLCEKMFSSSSALTKHKLTHSDERKYVCQLCTKAFKRQDHLNGHMLTHRTKKPYECQVEGCGKSYCDARSLRRHNENHHSQMNTELLKLQLGSHGPLAESASAQLQMMAAQGEHGLSPNRLHSALLGLINANSDQSKGSEGTTSAILLERLQQQQPKMWAELSGNAMRLDPGLVPKPVSCNMCQKSFKNMPALNGHMRLHGGYFKKENEVKKDCTDKKVVETSSYNNNMPSQHVSSSVRAKIEEKINQRKAEANQIINCNNNNVNGSSPQVITCTAAGSIPNFLSSSPLQLSSQNFSSQSSSRSLNSNQSHQFTSHPNVNSIHPYTTSETSIENQKQTFSLPVSALVTNSSQSIKSVITSEINISSNQLTTNSIIPNQDVGKIPDVDDLTQSSKFNLYGMQYSPDPVLQASSHDTVLQTTHHNPVLQTNNVQMSDSDKDLEDYSQIEPSVQNDIDEVFMYDTDLSKTIEDLKKAFLNDEKSRRHSDSDHFMIPKSWPSKSTNQRNDQLRRKALCQGRTYRLTSDPGGDPFYDIPDTTFIQNDDLPPVVEDNQQDGTFYPGPHDAQMQHFSNPSTPTQTTVNFFSGNQDISNTLAESPPQNDSSHHSQLPNTGSQNHSFIPIQVEQISAPGTPTQNHGSFFSVSQHEEQLPGPSTSTQRHTGFFENSIPQRQEPMSTPCTPTEPNVGFFQSQSHHASMPNTPTQQTTTFFPSHPQHKQYSNQDNASLLQEQLFSLQNQQNQNSGHSQPNNFFQHRQFSVPSTPTQSHVSFFPNGANQISAPNTPTKPHAPVSLFSYPPTNSISTTAYSSMQLPSNYDQTFLFDKPSDLQQTNQQVASLDDGQLNHSNTVFSDNFAGTLDHDNFMDTDDANGVNQMISSQNILTNSVHTQLPAISISDSVFDDIQNCDPQTTCLNDPKGVENCSKSITSNNSLLTIPKLNDGSDDVFVSPSSLPTSPIRMKRKNRPEPLCIPPHVNENVYQSRLRSPRLYDPAADRQVTPPPYTPPPMLSPRRTGSGLFWHMVSSSGSLTPKSAPVTPRFLLLRRSSSESVPKEDELDPPETDVDPHVNIGPQYQAVIPDLNGGIHDKNMKLDECTDDDEGLNTSKFRATYYSQHLRHLRHYDIIRSHKIDIYATEISQSCAEDF
ncbi:Zinc finger protein 541 [Nymphon striatum]|nr:Zinc finger protein 541 [Nymphon striatum]